MFVIAPTGAVARVIAMARADEASSVAGNGQMDSRGRLVYWSNLVSLPGVLMLGRGDVVCKERLPSPVACLNRHTDSAPLVRIDLTTRTVDTIATLATPKVIRESTADADGGLASVETTHDPLPIVDAWTMLRDGTVAVLRARDYHMDWLDETGKWTTTAS